MTTKKVFWRLLSIAVIAVLSVSLSACGGDDNDDNNYEALRSALFKEYANTSWKLVARTHNGVSESERIGSVVTFSTNSYEDSWIAKCVYVDGVLSGWWAVMDDAEDNVTPCLSIVWSDDDIGYSDGKLDYWDYFGFKSSMSENSTHWIERTSTKLTFADEYGKYKWYYVAVTIPND